MKQLILTGLATEQNFLSRNGEGTGDAQYFLIFNNGELRIPITENAAEIVVKAMYSEVTQSIEEPESYYSKFRESDATNNDVDGIDQI